MTRRVALLLGLLSVPASAPAGTLRGIVQLPAVSATLPRPRAEDAVVWLEQVPEHIEKDFALGRRGWILGRRRPPARVKLIAREQRFEPRVVAIAAGDSLVILNEDRVWHGVFSVTPENAFEIGKRPPGTADTLRLEHVGLVQVRCDIHPDMSATIVVTPNHARVRPNAAGEWRFPDLPEGDYVLHSWAPGLPELSRAVSVAFRGDTVVPLRW